MFLNYTEESEDHYPPMTMDTGESENQLSTGFSLLSNLSFPFMTQTGRKHLVRNESDIPISNASDSDYDIFDFWTLATYENLRQSVGWSIVLIIAYAVILLIGIIGNILVLLVMRFKPPMRTVTNMFLINLAIADLLVTVFCVPATLLSNLFIPWTLGSFMCKGVAYVQGVAVCASAFSLAALSLDRCKAIYRPMERHQGISKHQALVTILLIWIFSLLITLPWLFAFEVVEEEGQVYCVEAWQNEFLGKVYFVVAHLIFCYSVPLMIIGFSNIAVWCHVSKRQVPQDSVSVRRLHKRTRHGVRKTLGTLTLAFLICWLPLYALATYIEFSSVDGFSEWEGKVISFLLPIFQWLGSLNSGLNPVLYAFINSKFRKGFLSLFNSIRSKDYISMERSSNYRRRSQKMLRRQNAQHHRNPAHSRIVIRKAYSNGNGGASSTTDV